MSSTSTTASVGVARPAAVRAEAMVTTIAFALKSREILRDEKLPTNKLPGVRFEHQRFRMVRPITVRRAVKFYLLLSTQNVQFSQRRWMSVTTILVRSFLFANIFDNFVKRKQWLHRMNDFGEVLATAGEPWEIFYV